MNGTNNLYLSVLLSGIILIASFNYYTINHEYSLKLKDENSLLKNKLDEYNGIKNINSLLLKQNKEITEQNKELIVENTKLVNEISDLQRKVENFDKLSSQNTKLVNENISLINENNELKMKNNSYDKKINMSKINNEDKIMFDDELVNECYDNIPCNNLKKRTTNFFW